jgi:NADH-quinone oxidoreductase subunit I
MPAKEGEAAQMGPAPQKGARMPGRFIMDYSLCCLCGQCVKCCPPNALRFSNDPYVVSFDRKDFQFDLLARLRDQAPDRGDSELT